MNSYFINNVLEWFRDVLDKILADLIRTQDAYGIIASVQLYVPRPHKRVSWNVPSWIFSISSHLKLVFNFRFL